MSTAATSTGFANLRDVTTALPGSAIRAGVLFRSDAPFADDPSPTVAGWPPVAVIDLRDPEEARVAHPYGATASIHVLPLLGAATPAGQRSEEEEAERIVRIYRAMVKGRAAPYLVQAMGVIAEAPGAVLVHCAAGKDRTGVTVAFALRLCDVDRASVMTDYLVTDEARERLFHRLAIHYEVALDGVELPKHLLRTSRAGLDAVMDIWDAHEGGTKGWYLAHGGTAEMLTRLRARMMLAP